MSQICNSKRKVQWIPTLWCCKLSWCTSGCMDFTNWSYVNKSLRKHNKNRFLFLHNTFFVFFQFTLQFLYKKESVNLLLIPLKQKPKLNAPIFIDLLCYNNNNTKLRRYSSSNGPLSTMWVHQGIETWQRNLQTYWPELSSILTSQHVVIQQRVATLSPVILTWSK